MIKAAVRRWLMKMGFKRTGMPAKGIDRYVLDADRVIWVCEYYVRFWPSGTFSGTLVRYADPDFFVKIRELIR